MSNRRQSRWRSYAQMSEVELVRPALRQRTVFLYPDEGLRGADMTLALSEADQRRARWNLIRQGAAVPALPLALPAHRAAPLEVCHACFPPNL